METKYGFTKMNLQEFGQWLSGARVARTISKIQQHHTYIPGYQHFNGSNHFERQKAMRDHHVINNGWSDLAQHFTIFPDGAIVTGRALDTVPAGIKGHNATGICIENFGNFDAGKDQMNQAHKDAIVAVTAALCRKFNLVPTTQTIIYHHWFDLKTGERNNGTKNNKSCPGTAFFGGNKPEACELHFLPLVRGLIAGIPAHEPAGNLIRYAGVTADSLNIRSGPGSSHPIVADREPVRMGAILRIYGEQQGWLKISDSKAHWVSGKYTISLKQARVMAASLNVRSGPGTGFPKTGTLALDEEVFVFEEKDTWARVSLSERWVSSRYLKFL